MLLFNIDAKVGNPLVGRSKMLRVECIHWQA